MASATDKRIDPHTPSNFDPLAYEYVCDVYQGTDEDILAAYDGEMKIFNQIPEGQLFEGNHESNYTCDHCGTYFSYGVCFLHKPTGLHVVFGWECAKERVGVSDKSKFQRNRAAQIIRAKRQAKLNDEAVEKFLADGHEDLRGALSGYNADQHHILNDMAHKLRKYGDLSEAQVALARKLVDEEKNRAARKAEQAAADAAYEANKTPVVLGRGIVIEGTILSAYRKETSYGHTWKMIVLDDRQFKVWGTIPSALMDLVYGKELRGARVRFSATVTGGGDDESFGFFKNPRKAELLGWPEGE